MSCSSRYFSAAFLRILETLEKDLKKKDLHESLINFFSRIDEAANLAFETNPDTMRLIYDPSDTIKLIYNPSDL